jgi:hypothetical protein
MDLFPKSFYTSGYMPTAEAPTSPMAVVNAADLAVLTQCPLCHARDFHLEERKIFGIFKLRSWECDACGARFKKRGATYKLAALSNQATPIWQSYGHQALTSREWETIGSGGMSDAKQRTADMEQWMTKLKTGKVSVQCINAPSSLILQKNETMLCSIPHVTLKESRSVRVSSGSYGGPSFRVAKGVYFRVGSFGSTSRSYSEIKDIDTGVLTITNQRFAFSGKMKTVGVDLKKIVGIDPFSDGIAIHRTGYQKTQYFTWRNNIARLNIGTNGRSYEEPFSGLVLQYLIEGAMAGA